MTGIPAEPLHALICRYFFEKGFMQTYAAAGCYSGSCISASVILIIAISWFSLS